MTKDSSIRIDLDVARAAWAAFEAGYVQRHTSTRDDGGNAMDQEWEVFRPLVGRLFDELSMLRRAVDALEDRFELAQIEQRIGQLEKDYALANSAARSEAEAVPMPHQDCGFLFDYDDDTRTNHLFMTRDDRSVTLDVRQIADVARGVHRDEGCLTCAIHIPSLRRRSDGHPSEDVHEYVVSDPIQEEDLIEALRWLVGEAEELPGRARAVVADSKEAP